MNTTFFQNLRPAGNIGTKRQALHAKSTVKRPSSQSITRTEFDRFSSMIPIQTAVLGYCGDGLPVLIDFNDTQGGPILVTGDEGCGKTTLLQNFIQSSLANDPDHRFLFTVITDHPEEYGSLQDAGQCLGIYRPGDGGLEMHLQQIVSLIEKRSGRRQAAPPLLLVLDDLTCLAAASSSIRVSLETIFQKGTEERIWTLSALKTADCLEMGRWTRYFRMRLIGHMSNAAAHRLTIFGGLDAERLDARGEFAVMADGKWLIFQTPDTDPQNDETPEDQPVYDEEISGEKDENWNVVV